MSNKVCIIVLNWNGKEDTATCLQSLRKLTFKEAEILLVDNGSTDGSVPYFKQEFPECTIIETGENLGFAGGNNSGIEYGLKKGFSHFFILNNDTVVDPRIVEAFLSTFEAHPKAGILGAKIYLMDEPNRFDHFGGQWNPKRIDFDYTGHRLIDDEKTWEKPQKLDYVCGAGIMVRSEVFESIGLFDPRFFLFWEETDLCFRARNAGYEVLFSPEAKLWHKVSASFTGGKPHATYFFWRNRLLWVERNFSGIERIFYFSRLLAFNGAALLTLKTIRSMQLLLQHLFKKRTRRNLDRIVRYNAALYGMQDYLKRCFGPGRSTLFH